MLIILKENIKYPTEEEASFKTTLKKKLLNGLICFQLMCLYCSENATKDIHFLYETCPECVRPYHNDCILKMHGETDDEWVCKSCKEKVKLFLYFLYFVYLIAVNFIVG
jgi:hypothetical protein